MYQQTAAFHQLIPPTLLLPSAPSHQTTKFPSNNPAPVLLLGAVRAAALTVCRPVMLCHAVLGGVGICILLRCCCLCKVLLTQLVPELEVALLCCGNEQH